MEDLREEGEVKMKWKCLLCSFVYDESKGLPEEGIPEGTSWEDIPEDWYCPDCGVSKSKFTMMQVHN